MPPSYQQILAYNEKWIVEKIASNPDFFSNLCAEQKPDYLFIGCSDSRVDPDIFTGLNLGDMFVHRNISNIVNPIDLNVASVIQYAITNLKVKHIIVCGHYGCGGIKAAMTPEDLGLLNPWLRTIRDVYRLHQAELDAIENEQKRYDRLVELNVQEQCINVIKMASVQEEYILDEYPVVHGWVFDMATGKIIDLEIDFEKILKDIQKIYNLTNSDWVMSRKKK